MARTHIVPVTVTGDLTVHTPPAGVNSVSTVHGWSFRSTAGATVYIRSGTTDSDPIIATVQLAANESHTVISDCGVQCRNGVRVDASAAIEGAVYVS